MPVRSLCTTAKNRTAAIQAVGCRPRAVSRDDSQAGGWRPEVRGRKAFPLQDILRFGCGVCWFALATIADADGLGPIGEALGETKPIVDARLRYENVEQVGVPRDADAVTLRARLGFETGKAWETALLVEGEFVTPLDSNYNSTVNGKTQYATVADPENYELNRLQLTNTSLPQTTITLGRQRVNLDDQRFVGNAGWRQNEQTFDALRVVNRTLTNVTVDVTYLNQVNRVFGKDSPQGAYQGDNLLANLAYQTSIGKLTGFGYLLKFDPIPGVPAAIRDSSATYGARFSGERPLSRIKLGYVVSYAHQEDRGANPIKFGDDYYFAELTATYRQFNIGAGWEILDGDGTKGFTTPLATLHKFQGWADKFLTTPPNGIDDRYVNAGFLMKGVGPFDTVSATASYHDFHSQRLWLKYGNEVNLQLQAKWHRFLGTLKYADYNAEGFATDTTKYWAQIEFVW